jgi:DNA-binding response OmpR family regulator
MAKAKVLIVEDDESILNGLELNLGLEGYEVVIARDGPSGIEQHQKHRPDLVLLDVMLPEKDGFEVLTAIRAIDARVPVLILTAKDHQQDKIAGLGLGADDYVTKPFSLPELLARIGAALRRARLPSGPGKQSALAFGDIMIDTTNRRVTKRGEQIDLTFREYELLMYLARGKDRVVTRNQILQSVWGDDYEGTERTVDNFILRLRQKIEDEPDSPRHIQTVRGFGYRFVP